MFLLEPVTDYQRFFYPPLCSRPIAAGVPDNICDIVSLFIHLKNIHQHAQRDPEYWQ